MQLIQNTNTLIQLSRPRFWLYLAGPALLGIVAASPSWTTMLTLPSVCLLIYFLFPANTWVYGVNDWYDGDTDQFNQKKRDKESFLDSPKKLLALQSILFFVSATVVALILLPTQAQFWLWIFVGLSWLYSAPPVRFKSRPFLDAASNVLYVIPFYVVYSALTGESPSAWYLLIAGCWTAGMHIFSAIPDIRPDSQAFINTTATYLGQKKALLLVCTLWLITSLTTLSIFGTIVLPLLLYPLLVGLILYILVTKEMTDSESENFLIKVYWWFPYINAAIGFYLFWVIAINRFGITQIISSL